MFFFEKKNQKTFIPGSQPRESGEANRAEVFCFFFFKKKAFLQ